MNRSKSLIIGSFLAFLFYVLFRLIIDNYSSSPNSIENKLSDRFWFTESNIGLFFENKLEGVYFLNALFNIQVQFCHQYLPRFLTIFYYFFNTG